jgi:hypothetical protein
MMALGAAKTTEGWKETLLEELQDEPDVLGSAQGMIATLFLDAVKALPDGQPDFAWITDTDSAKAFLDEMVFAANTFDLGPLFAYLSKPRIALLLRAVERQHANLFVLRALAAPNAGRFRSKARQLEDEFDDDPVKKMVCESLDYGKLFEIAPVAKKKSDLPDDGKDEIPFDWKPEVITRIKEVLAELPPSHVKGNDRLGSIQRYRKPLDQRSGGGDYSSRDKRIRVNQDKRTLERVEPREKDRKKKNDYRSGAISQFDKTLRHEVGHAVDAKIGFSTTYGTTPFGGGWKDYGDKSNQYVADLIADADADGALPSMKTTTDGAQVLKQIFKEVATAKGALAEDHVEQILETHGDPKPERHAKDVYKSRAYDVVLAGKGEDSWQRSKPALGPHVYQQSYESQWTRYQAAALARRVSTYQFRAPGEWFAEAYAAYYEPTRFDEQRGDLLKRIDPVTWGFFVAHIDKGDDVETLTPLTQPLVDKTIQTLALPAKQKPPKKNVELDEDDPWSGLQALLGTKLDRYLKETSNIKKAVKTPEARAYLERIAGGGETTNNDDSGNGKDTSHDGEFDGHDGGFDGHDGGFDGELSVDELGTDGETEH